LNLIDTHAHLDEIKDIEEALHRAKEIGIRAIVGVGSDLASNEKILQWATDHPGFIYPALGMHPWRLDSDNLEANFSLIQRELPRCLALGEIGLDFALEIPQDHQREVLGRLLEMAFQERKPVLLHARRAWGAVLDLVKKFKVEKAVFHWYSGPEDILRGLLERGYYISATPAASYSERHRRAIRVAPLDRLLLETDAPEVYRGNPSEPKDLLKTLHAVSQLKGLGIEKIAEQTFENAQNLFQLKLT
jgi:TatD DNase family protein